MVYPFSKFNVDYATACIAIRREILKLCKDGRMDLLLMINRAVDIEVDVNNNNETLCNNIINKIINTCISIDPMTSVKVGLNLKYGIVPDIFVEEIPEVPDIDLRGFRKLQFVNDNMREFFSGANLGPSDPSDPNSEPLNNFLSVGVNGISNRAMLTPILYIYARVNNMWKDPEFMTSTARMNQYFQDTYDRLAARPQKYYRNRETRGPDLTRPIPKFDPERFKYAGLQMIIADNMMPKDQYTHQQLELLKDPAIKQRIYQEQIFISNILKQYKAKK